MYHFTFLLALVVFVESQVLPQKFITSKGSAPTNVTPVIFHYSAFGKVHFRNTDFRSYTIWIETIYAFSELRMFGRTPPPGIVFPLKFSFSAGSLFHRVVLMSGSARPLVADHEEVVTTVARHVHCPLDHRLLHCLRSRPLEALLSVPVARSTFSTPFGPVEDGVIVVSKDSYQGTHAVKRCRIYGNKLC